PGGHKIGPKKRFKRVRNDDGSLSTAWEIIDPEPYPTEGLVPLEAPKGTLIVLHGLLPHLSGANNSDKSRHAYTLHCVDRRADWPADNWLQRPGLPLRGFRD
ncbi:MAG: phytanoyl-CoA dioxygenase family protein, partial [Actinobacteria bacterium]|nr:phytanoyl-CoA dioxygenase family protein [Actinomycetota bacterium]